MSAELTVDDYKNMKGAIQAIISEYSGKDPTLDLYVQRLVELREKSQVLEKHWMAEPFYEMPNGALVSHPNLKAWIELEKLIHQTCREMGFIARMVAVEKAEDDPLDTFLENLERTNRPHRSVNRAGG